MGRARQPPASRSRRSIGSLALTGRTGLSHCVGHPLAGRVAVRAVDGEAMGASP